MQFVEYVVVNYVSFYIMFIFIGIIWGKDILFEYLENFKKYIFGIKMVFVGIKKVQERGYLIVYFESLIK